MDTNPTIRARLHWLVNEVAAIPDSENTVQAAYRLSHLRDHARETQRLITEATAQSMLELGALNPPVDVERLGLP